jgi:hypothetical protein
MPSAIILSRIQRGVRMRSEGAWVRCGSRDLAQCGTRAQDAGTSVRRGLLRSSDPPDTHCLYTCADRPPRGPPTAGRRASTLFEFSNRTSSSY